MQQVGQQELTEQTDEGRPPHVRSFCLSFLNHRPVGAYSPLTGKALLSERNEAKCVGVA